MFKTFVLRPDKMCGTTARYFDALLGRDAVAAAVVNADPEQGEIRPGGGPAVQGADHQTG